VRNTWVSRELLPCERNIFALQRDKVIVSGEVLLIKSSEPINEHPSKLILTDFHCLKEVTNKDVPHLRKLHQTMNCIYKGDDTIRKQCCFGCLDSACWCPVWCLPMSMWTSKILRCLRRAKNIKNLARKIWLDIQKNKVSGCTKSVPCVSPYQSGKPSKHIFHPLPTSDMFADVACKVTVTWRDTSTLVAWGSDSIVLVMSSLFRIMS